MSIHWPAVLDRIPSWLVELASGLLFVAGAVATLSLAASHHALAVCVLATAGSFLYETKLDANGFSWRDIAQRQAGILAGLLVLLLFHL